MPNERKPLPPPATYGDAYLHAIASELRDLNDKLDGLIRTRLTPADADAAEVDLREPAKPTARTSKKAASKEAS